MDKLLFKSFIIDDRSQLAFIKREIHNLVKPVFSVQRTGEIDIVVAEMMSNIIKYAARGEILFRLQEIAHSFLFEAICIDNGPGMKDVLISSRDGMSTKNTLGHGLGSIARLSNFSQVYSQPDWGTIVYTQFINNGDQLPNRGYPGIIARCLTVALPGQLVCGDGTAIRILDGKIMFFVGDGLGHGPHAKDAADKAIGIFNSSMSCDPVEIIREMNGGLKKSRGLVGTVAVMDTERKKWELCGIGNIYTR
jgi:anti-sigma regulatory factor (Ser/Thr protein kinase)